MSTLQELLNLGLVAIGSDDSRFAKMEAAGAALIKHLLEQSSARHPCNFDRYRLRRRRKRSYLDVG